MKLALSFIVLGVLLVGDGRATITFSMFMGDIISGLARVLIELALGGFLLYKGIGRYIRIKSQGSLPLIK